MYYIVDSSRAFEGAPNLNPATGQLALPHGEALAEGIGWTTITIKPGEMPDSWKQVSQKRPSRLS
jgi:hypothetical protein